MSRGSLLLGVVSAFLALQACSPAGEVGEESAPTGPSIDELLERAKGGDAEAQFAVGKRYGEGEGVSQDFEAAARWIRAAAEQSNAEAAFVLGAMYSTGQGVAQDWSAAARWLEEAAEQGHGPALRNLGLMYATGEGIARDPVQASILLELAVSRLSATEVSILSNIRKKLSEEMTPEQTQEAERRVREWKPRVSPGVSTPEEPMPSNADPDQDPQ